MQWKCEITFYNKKLFFFCRSTEHIFHRLLIDKHSCSFLVYKIRFATAECKEGVGLSFQFPSFPKSIDSSKSHTRSYVESSQKKFWSRLSTSFAYKRKSFILIFFLTYCFHGITCVCASSSNRLSLLLSLKSLIV